jgi:glycosyltransferase involved in cell wall biosynthesis
MNQAFIFVDNLRIGGFQRLALDQAYGLGDRGFNTSILVLDDIPTTRVPSFLTSEVALIETHNVKLASIGKTRKSQLLAMVRILKSQPAPTLLLSHSLRATLLLRIASWVSQQPAKIITTIHQLPTLSAPKQRLLRFVYAQFTWRLIAYSEAVKADWDARVNGNRMFKTLVARKRIQVIRNGIYLNRLPSDVNASADDTQRRLVYLGRNTAWKGINTFLEIAGQPELQHFELLFMIPDEKDLDVEALPNSIKHRIQVLAGKPISAFTPRKGDVHLYPANYGAAAKFVESVSLNCLELACLGVPTILTVRGLGTWPDLAGAGIFHETDWQDHSGIARTILEISHERITDWKIEEVKNKVSIQNQISSLLNLSD